ncbi:hypothetical protein [Agarivorans sp.]|uniref:hypothetical protein n=1 Tax=Agarivorans sp. TaxID=1872412 RepID=UPI003D01B5DC
MQISHPSTVRVGNQSYDYSITSVTKTYAGAKVLNDGTNIYLEDENGKVETLKTEYKPDIPPSTQLISTLWGEDKRAKKRFLFGYYNHSNDFIGYTTNYQNVNAAKRIIQLHGFNATLERFRWLVILAFAALFAWTGFWTGINFSLSGLINFITAIPYVLWETPSMLANMQSYGRYYNVSLGGAFIGLIGGFAVGKLLLALTVGRLRSKLRIEFANNLRDQLTNTFAQGEHPNNGLSDTPKTDADGYQSLI